MLPLAALLARPGNLPLVVALRDFVTLGDVARTDPFPRSSGRDSETGKSRIGVTRRECRAAGLAVNWRFDVMCTRCVSPCGAI